MSLISMMLGGTPQLPEMSRVVMNSSAQMTQLSEKMLKTGLELKLGKEMGKGALLDVSA